jgi:hypothetical protein
MINHRRLVGYAGSSACHHVWKVIVLLEAPARLGENGMKLSPERTILDILDLTRQIDPAMPNFHRRQFRQGAHASPIGFNRFCCSCTRALLGKSLRECRYRNARSQPLEVNREVDPGQGLIKIIDVEQNVFLRRGKSSEVHQVAIATRLDVSGPAP